MILVKNLIKIFLCLSGLMLISVAEAQKMADLLVTKDAKPGQWSTIPTQIPKGLETNMKAESFCASKEELLGFLNGPIQMMSNGNNGENICPTIMVSNTPTEAIMKIKCTERSISINAEATYSIKRTANDTWTFTLSGLNGGGTLSNMQTTMKYIGSCR